MRPTSPFQAHTQAQDMASPHVKLQMNVLASQLAKALISRSDYLKEMKALKNQTLISRTRLLKLK